MSKLDDCARALIDLDPTITGYHEDHLAVMRPKARAVIAELREPSKAMQNAGRITAFRILFPHGTPLEEADCQAAAYAGFQAMLDAVDE